MSADIERKQVVLGQIGKVHGINGWLKLNSFTTPPENILSYSQLSAEFEEDWQVLEIDQHRQQANGLIVHFAGYDDPETAKKLTGRKLVVATKDLPSLETGSFYWHELEGLEVINEEGLIFGKIDRLLETGANDVLVVQPTSTSFDERERLIPYIKESVIKEIDTKAGKVLVSWEADYLE
ncbi:MAG: ribosome maturation factor RimM [Pseudomonadales bacterium]|nr:ribosome maturation factor RimM [Pseudomonadales bacterium]